MKNNFLASTEKNASILPSYILLIIIWI